MLVHSFLDGGIFTDALNSHILLYGYNGGMSYEPVFGLQRPCSPMNRFCTGVFTPARLKSSRL